jgi:prepilin-type N-terminal cleavage/methylation domain-containing protein
MGLFKSINMTESSVHSGAKSANFRQKGFTFIEILVVVGVMGVILAAIYPSIQNTLETRGLENSARDILTTMQRAKFQAVKTKINHRVGFLYDDGKWYYFIEREDTPGTWNPMPGFLRKEIPQKFIISVNFPDIVGTPDKGVEFSPLGFVTNFSTNQNSISLQSQKLQGYGQPDLRVVSAFAGGSIHYNKTGS